MAKDLTIYHLVKTQGERDPHAVAILAPNRPPLTYEALCLQVERTAEQLAATGITRHDRVAIVLPNGPEMATAFLGVASWATSAPLNPAYRDTEFDFFLRDLRAKALIVRADLDSPARQVARGRGIPVIDLVPQSGAAAGVFDLFGDARAGATARELAQPDDVALVLHTSGTTSRPKIVPLTHVNVCTSAHNIMTGLALTDRDRCLNVMPLFHIHGLVGATLSSLAAGASLVSTPGFQADQFLGWLEAFRPTWYTAVPTMHQAILARTRADGHIAAHSSLRFIRSCSAALAPQVLAELEERFKVAVIEAYGMTEASHQVTSNLLPPRPRKPGTVGVAAGPEVAIMDEAGILLPACQNGEVVIRGASVTSGYEGNPEANQRAFTNGWFRTGDHGTMDEDGYLSIVGRIKEMVNRGGEKIAPREVDEVLLEHPDVAEAVAFAVPHRTLGEDLAAAVVLRAKANRTERELRQFAFSRLADHKVPSRIVVVDQIPKGPTGKVQRIGLAEKLASRLRAEYVPPRNRLEEALAGIWAETLDLDKVGIEDNFFTLGGDSLAAVQASLAVETLTGKQLHRSIVFEAPTIGQLAQVLQDGAALAEHSVVLPLQPKGGKTPFFCVPGHGGNVFKFADLARCLGPDRPFYVFRFPGRRKRATRRPMPCLNSSPANMSESCRPSNRMVPTFWVVFASVVRSLSRWRGGCMGRESWSASWPSWSCTWRGRFEDPSGD